jgi:List-Bact-rpt repeat protein
MSTIARVIGAVAVTTVLACGRSPQALTDGSVSGDGMPSNPDAASDAAADAAIDGPVDAPPDASPDAPPDATPMATLTVTRVGAGTVTSNDGTILCPGVCTTTLPVGTSVTLSFDPAIGSMFLGWEGDCHGFASCTVTLTADRAVTARFGDATVDRVKVVPGVGLNRVDKVLAHPSGDLIVAGPFSASVNLGGSTLMPSPTENNPYFIGRISGIDGHHVWSRTLPNALWSFALDANGNVVVALDIGSSFTIDGMTIHGAADRAVGIAVLDGESGFASQPQVIGMATNIVTQIGNIVFPQIAVAANGDLVVIAPLSGTAIIGGQTFDGSNGHVVVTRVSPTGEARFAFQIPNSGGLAQVAIAPGDHIVISGGVAGSLTLPGQPPITAQPKDSFIAALDGTGQHVLWSRLLGGGTIEKFSIRGNRLAVLGEFDSNIDLGTGTIAVVPSPHPVNAPEPKDAFVGVLATDTGQPVWARGIDQGGDQSLFTHDLTFADVLLVSPTNVALAGALQAKLLVADVAIVEPFGFENGILLSLGSNGSVTSIARLGGEGGASLNGIAASGSQLFGVGAARDTNNIGGVSVVLDHDVDGFVLHFTPAATTMGSRRPR